MHDHACSPCSPSFAFAFAWHIFIFPALARQSRRAKSKSSDQAYMHYHGLHYGIWNTDKQTTSDGERHSLPLKVVGTVPAGVRGDQF